MRMRRAHVRCGLACAVTEAINACPSPLREVWQLSCTRHPDEYRRRPSRALTVRSQDQGGVPWR